MFAERRWFIPGTYLYATRYFGVVPVVGFVWLEMLPSVAFLYSLIGTGALLFPLLHYVFLGVYEIGYLVNDRADTAKERTSRLTPEIGGGHLVCFFVARISIFAATAIGIAYFTRPEHALGFVVGSGVVLLLLIVHTGVGELTFPLSKFRYATFALLALLKYGPAALALVTVDEVSMLLFALFVCYGGGRVIAYVVGKEAKREIFLPFNLGWFVCVGVPTVITCWSIGLLTQAMVSVAAVFVAYYVTSGLNRLRRQN